MRFLTEEQTMRAKMLSPDTITYYENEVEALTDALVNHNFGATQEEQTYLVRSFVEIQAKRAVFVQLLTDCSESYAAVAASQQTHK